MKGKNPNSQGLKWQARCKRRAKKETGERVAWGEEEEGKAAASAPVEAKEEKKPKKESLVDDPLAVEKHLKTKKSKKKRKNESWRVETSGGREPVMGVKKKKQLQSSISTPKYASGNPFAALAAMKKRG
jgi:hypothetical protein